jgi:hypothetical protein
MNNLGREERKRSKKIILSILVAFIILMPLFLDIGIKAKVKTENDIKLNLKSGWVKHFEGTSWGHTVIQTSDGGYLIGGGTGWDTGSDALLIKTDSEGNKEWEKKFGYMGWDAFEGLCETNDGSFAASGIDSARGYLVKIDADGNLIWHKNYGTDTGYCIDLRQTLDGGFILAGYYYTEPSSGWLIKTDSEGNELWSKNYIGEHPRTIHSVRITSDGGFILSGWENTTAWALKTDNNGNIEWEQFYDWTGVFHSGMQTSDGGYIFTGPVKPSFLLDWSQIHLVKTDSEGNVLWTRDYGTLFFTETSLWVEETEDNGFIVVGNYLGIGTSINYIQTGILFPLWGKIWIIKTDSNGDFEWDNKIESGLGRCVKQTIDNGFIITGQRGSYNYPEGVLLIKTDENGNID